jgi:hypothetical protein
VMLAPRWRGYPAWAGYVTPVVVGVASVVISVLLMRSTA